MLYIVTIRYTQPLNVVIRHLDTHRAWLSEFIGSGHIVAAGPLETDDGGIVLAHCESREELDLMIAKDSYFAHGIARYDVQTFKVLLRADLLPAKWAPGAKAIPAR